MWGKMGEGEIKGDRGMGMGVEGVWNLGQMGMLSCKRLGIEMLVCVLMLVVVVVLLVVLVSMVLMVWVWRLSWQWSWRQ